MRTGSSRWKYLRLGGDFFLCAEAGVFYTLDAVTEFFAKFLTHMQFCADAAEVFLGVFNQRPELRIVLVVFCIPFFYVLPEKPRVLFPSCSIMRPNAPEFHVMKP